MVVEAPKPVVTSVYRNGKQGLDVSRLPVKYHDYSPEGACRELFRNKSHELIISGPAGTGKSRACLEKVHWILEKYRRIRVLMIRKTRRSMTQSCIVTYEQEVLPRPDYIPFHGGDQEYRYPTGSIFAIAGLDDPQKIYSSQWDIIYVNQCEELSEEEWTQVRSRNRNYVMPYQQLLGDCNPGPPQHWILSRRAQGLCAVLESRHEDNPVYWDKEKQEWTDKGRDYVFGTLDALPGALKQRLRYGKWASAEGAVYQDSWDRAHHVIPRFFKDVPLTEDQVPKDWPRIWSIDFGYKNPFCFDKYTEILTRTGWVPFPKFVLGKYEVGTVNEKSHRFEWQMPFDFIKYKFDGELIKTNSKQQSADFAVTPDHDMIVESRKSRGSWKRVKAEKLAKGSSIPVSWKSVKCHNQTTQVSIPDFSVRRGGMPRIQLSSVSARVFCEFLGLFIADGDLHLSGHGSSKYVRITQSKHSKRLSEIRRVLNSTGWSYSEAPAPSDCISFSITSSNLFDFLSSLGLHVYSAFKFVPKQVFEWNVECLKALISGLMLGDGSFQHTISKTGESYPEKRFHTTSQQLADDVQHIACLLGLPTKIHKSNRDPEAGFGGGNNSSEFGFTVSFHIHGSASVEGLHLSREKYNDFVYCVSVPNQTLIVRRNGRPMVCGNCWQAWAKDPDGRLFLYKQIYMTNRIVSDHAKQIKEVTKNDPKPIAIICDTDAEDRATFERELGWQTKGAWKAVSVGIQGVEARLRKAGDGKARLFFLEESLIEIDQTLLAAKKPTRTEDEFEVYVWETSSGRRKGEEPKKENDHGCDGVRYCVAHVDELNKRTMPMFQMGSITKSGSGGNTASYGMTRPSGFRMPSNAPSKFGGNR